MRGGAAPAALTALAVLLGAPAATAEPVVGSGLGGARAFSVQVVAPGQPGLVVGSTEAPPDATAGGAASYPADGSIVSVASSGSTLTAKPGDAPTASVAVDVGRVSLFGGEITADAVAVRVQAEAGPKGAFGDFTGSAVSNLVVLGQTVPSGTHVELRLGDWGRAVVLEQSTDLAGVPTASYKGTLIGLDVRVDADHGGLPAGSRILIGYAEAWGTSAVPVETPPASSAEKAPFAPPVIAPVSRPKDAKPVAPIRSRTLRDADERLRPPEPDRLEDGRPSPFVVPPTNLTPKLTAGGYVFPVYGPAAYTDTFAAPRADVSYHHGGDIFAPLGAPILAVADGTVFSVGWNDIGGNRLWLRDGEGKQFYYAHLSAFSTLAVNGRRVKAGDVIGFLGNTGDAEGTPFHLHFEVHPVELLFLGYDGAVNPTAYLNAWRRLEDIEIRAAVGKSPGSAPVAQAPLPGAILLQSSDISTANGLDPDSLRKALALPPGSPGGGVPVPLVDLGRS